MHVNEYTHINHTYKRKYIYLANTIFLAVLK